MNPLIEFCVNNLLSGSEQALKELENDERLDVVSYDCLTYCDTCATSPYALVEGEIIRGNTPDELIHNIYTYLYDEDYLEKAQ